MKISPEQIDSQFRSVLSKLGSQVGDRYHVAPETIEEKYQISETVLGCGSSGTVRLAHSRSEKKAFAVKSVDFSTVLTFNDWKTIQKQLEVALVVDHANVVGVVDVYETAHSLHFVMPLMEGGQLVEHEDAQPLPEKDVRKFARQMLSALAYMHSRGIVHRDVKPGNFVFETDCGSALKLIDFDVSTFWKIGDAKMSTFCGTPGFMSPELQNRQGYTNKTDMWSLGVTLFTVLVGEMPFSPDEPLSQEIVDKLLTRDSRVVDLSSEAVHFLGKLLRITPTERLSTEEALQHPFIAAQSHRKPNEPVDQTCASVVCKQSYRRRQRHGGRRVTNTRLKKECHALRPFECNANVQVDMTNLLKAFDEQFCAVAEPTLPVQHKAARARWADLEDEDEDCCFVQRKVAKPRWADLKEEEDEAYRVGSL